MSDEIRTSKIYHWRGICLTSLTADMDPVINVVPYSAIPLHLDGPVAAGTSVQSVEFVDASGVTRTGNVTTANHIRARWLKNDINVLPPLVQVGEQVEVYQFSNGGEYFWLSTGRDRKLRTVDRVRIEASAANGTGQDKTDNNSYALTLDPTVEFAGLSTSKALEEFAAYRIGVANGDTVIITDDTGLNNSVPGSDSTNTPTTKSQSNSIVVKSRENSIYVTTAQGTTLAIKGDSIVAYAPNSIAFTAGKQIAFHAPQILGTSSQTLWNAEAFGLKGKSFVCNVTYSAFNSSMTVTGSLASGNIRSPLYTNGDAPVSVPIAQVNTKDGTGTSNLIQPDTATPSSSRTLSDWDNTNSTVDAICEALLQLATAAHTTIDVSPIKQAFQSAKVQKITGEHQ